MMAARLNLLLILILLCHLLKAQDYLLNNFSVDDGLASKEVHDLQFDDLGRLWMATDLGVSYFDGYGFTNLSIGDGLADIPVYELYKDSRKRLWAISASGQLTIIDNGKLSHYKYNSKIENFRHNISSPHSDFYVDDYDNVFISFHGNGELIIDSSGQTTMLHNEVSNSEMRVQVYEKLNDSVYFFFSLKSNPDIITIKGFQTHLKMNPTEIVELESQFSRLSYQFANYLYIKDILVISLNEDIYGFRGNELIGTFKFDHPIIKMTQIDDEIWISSHKGGVIIQKTDSLFSKNYRSVMNGEIVTEVLQDINGGIWISSVEFGIFHIPNKNFKHYSNRNTLEDNDITSIAKAGAKIYCGNSLSRIQVIEKGKLVKTFPLPFEGFSQVKKIISTELGVFAVCQNRVTQIKNDGSTSFVLCENDKDDKRCNVKNLYKTKNGGLLLIGGELWELGNSIDAKQLISKDSNGTIYLSAEEDSIGKYWLGSNAGLFHFDGKNIEDLGKNNELLSTKISALSKLNNQCLVVGTLGKGLILFDWTKNKCASVNSDLFALGIRINDIKIVSEKECWIATQSGLYLLQFDSKDLSNPKVRRYSTLDGLPSVRISEILEQEDTLYLATDNGISILPKNELLASSKPPQLIIEVIDINGIHTNVSELGNLKYDQNRIAIKFKGIDIKSKGMLEYKYRLIGSDDSWHSTRERTINYNGLPEGDYTFELKVINNDGVESESTYTIPFLINPPYWKTWWFVLFETLFFVGLISFVFYRRGIAIKENAELKIRLNKEKADMEILALRAQMNPHFIFNTFNSIQYLIHSKQNEKAEYFLEKFSRLLRRIVDHGMELNIKLIDEIDMLRTYIDLQNLRFDGKFDFELIIDDAILLEKTKLPGMIIQPFIENALEHGLLNKDGQGKIELTIEKTKDIIRIKVKDNGVGREKAKQMKRGSGVKRNSIGFENVAKRIELLQGPGQHNYIIINDLKDESGSPSGTEVIIELSENTI